MSPMNPCQSKTVPSAPGMRTSLWLPIALILIGCFAQPVEPASAGERYEFSLSRPGSRFVRWVQLPNEYGTLEFCGSILLKARGENGVSSVLVRARGTGSDDFSQKILVPRTLKPGTEVFSHMTADGIVFKVLVHPASINGRTFIVTIDSPAAGSTD